jgi:hypothetical protein
MLPGSAVVSRVRTVLFEYSDNVHLMSLAERCWSLARALLSAPDMLIEVLRR